MAMGFNIARGLNADIESLSMENGNEWKALLREKYLQLQPAISPDGRWIAYSSYESGIAEIYARPFPQIDSGKWQLSAKGGQTPIWSPDGRELFYRSGDAVMAVTIETTPAFKPGKPEILFRSLHVPFSTLDLRPWDISPDGKRFLMMKEQGSDTTAGAGPRKINVILNWFEELKQRVPASAN